MKQTEKEKSYYDKENEYNEKIAPLIKDLQLFCLEYRLPMFITVAVGNDENGTKYKSNVILSASGIHLTDNRIAKVLMSLNGFEQALPKNIKMALTEIIDYVYKVKGKEISSYDSTDVELTDDAISRILFLVEGDDKIDFQAKRAVEAASSSSEDDSSE